MNRILFDINVALDAALARPPHSEAATKIWAAVDARRITGLLPAHGVTTLYYLLARAKGAAAARRAIAHLLTVFGVAAVNHAILQRALALGWPAFEDAVCAAAAQASGCDFIVTRDPSGFPESPVPCVDPATALALLDLTDAPHGVAERPARRYAPRSKQRRLRRTGASGSASRPQRAPAPAPFR